MLFSKSLHLRLRWQHFSRLQFKAKDPNFHAELIPVHSPLLRESFLVSFPPLTYMLKFSGFADLTSCLGNNRKCGEIEESQIRQATKKDGDESHSSSCSTKNSPLVTCVKKHIDAQTLSPGSNKISLSRGMIRIDTEAGMLSGISRKRSMRSSTCWFTEFCNSQCLSHFAAPFIVVRAETSVAESCK